MRRCPARDAAETEGVNDRVQLAAAGRVLNRRLLEAAMRAGVTVIDPATTWLSTPSQLSSPTSPCCPAPSSRRARASATEAVIGPDSTLNDSEIGAGAHGSRARPPTSP